MEKVIGIEIPEEPKWETLEERLRCKDCKVKSCERRYQLNMLLDCPRKARLLNFIFNWISAIPVFFLFQKAFTLASEKFFLAISISLAILFFYDMIFVLIEKSITVFFTFMEKRRKEKYNEKVKEIKALKGKKKEEEKEMEKKEKLRFQEIENAVNLYKEFENLENRQAIKARFDKPYKQMLTALKELCDDLQLEHFANPTVKNLFKIYLPEVLEISRNFVLQYDKELLTAKEITMFRKLLKTTREKFITVKQSMWQKETTNLYVNMLALDEALSTNCNKEDRK